MKALTIWHPYASLLVDGIKQFETRGWRTHYRGPLLICSAKKWDAGIKRDVDRVVTLLRHHSTDEIAESLFESCSRSIGCAVGVVDLIDCQPMMDGGSELENAVGYFGEGRFGWKCANCCRFIEPIAVVGKQGLWNPSQELIDSVIRLKKV